MSCHDDNHCDKAHPLDISLTWCSLAQVSAQVQRHGLPRGDRRMAGWRQMTHARNGRADPSANPGSGVSLTEAADRYGQPSQWLLNRGPFLIRDHRPSPLRAAAQVGTHVGLSVSGRDEPLTDHQMGTRRARQERLTRRFRPGRFPGLAFRFGKEPLNCSSLRGRVL